MQGVPYVSGHHLPIEHSYRPRSLELRACHPRDLVMLIKDVARYRHIPPALTQELFDQAVQVSSSTRNDVGLSLTLKPRNF